MSAQSAAADSLGGAVVTGAGRGLGLRIAELLATRGHDVLVTDVDEGLARAAATRIGPRATPMRVDVRDPEHIEAAGARITDISGRLQVWVNNAGVLSTGPFWTQAEPVRKLIFDVNAYGTIQGTIHAIERMRRSGGGHIINIASLAGLSPVPGEAVYAASKHAVVGFSLSAASDLMLEGIDDIHISCVCPDGIWSPMLYDKLDDPGAALSFSGKLLEPDDVVEVVADTLDAPRLITAVPRWRGAQARLAAAFPTLATAAMPLVVNSGRRKQRKLRAGRLPTGRGKTNS